MKEIIVTEPGECPFRYLHIGHKCNINIGFNCNEPDNSFPSDCPLFENDYLIKRKRRYYKWPSYQCQREKPRCPKEQQ